MGFTEMRDIFGSFHNGNNESNPVLIGSSDESLASLGRICRWLFPYLVMGRERPGFLRLSSAESLFEAVKWLPSHVGSQ